MSILDLKEHTKDNFDMKKGHGSIIISVEIIKCIKMNYELNILLED